MFATVSSKHAANFLQDRLSDPVLKGLRFAWTFRRTLITLAIAPWLIEVVGAYVQFYRPLQRQDQFLVAVTAIAANAWLLISLFLFVVETVHQRRVTLPGIMGDAIRFLPKVFLSYLALVSLVLSLVSAPQVLPLMLPALFLIWAPFFCAGEFYAPITTDDDEDEEVWDDEERYDFDAQRMPTRKQRLFSGKYFWELGFARALQFSGQRTALTLQIVLLYWFANVVPAACIDLFSVSHPGFGVLFLKILLSSLFGVLILTAAIVAFISTIPLDAKEELGLPKGPNSAEQASAERPALGSTEALRRYQWRKVFTILLFVCSVAGTVTSLNQLRRERSVPESVVVELTQIARRGGLIEAHIVLTDSSNHFRWLTPDGLQVAFESPEAKADAEPQSRETEAPSTSAGESAVSGVRNTDNVRTPDPDLSAPMRIILFDEQGREINPRGFAPHYGPISAILYFGTSEQVPAGGALSLYYVSPFGLEANKLLLKKSYSMDTTGS